MFEKVTNVRLYDEVDGRLIKVGIASYAIFDVEKERVKPLSEFYNLPFIVRDLIRLIIDSKIPVKNVTCIIRFRIYKKYRNRGIGTRQFKKFIESLDSSHAICIKSSALTADYPTEPDDETRAIELRNQGYFLEVNGFRNINSLCEFESGVAYLYINDIAKPVLKKIINSEIK